MRIRTFSIIVILIISLICTFIMPNVVFSTDAMFVWSNDEGILTSTEPSTSTNTDNTLHLESRKCYSHGTALWQNIILT